MHGTVKTTVYARVGIVHHVWRAFVVLWRVRTHDDVNELIRGSVLAEQHMGVVHLVLLQN